MTRRNGRLGLGFLLLVSGALLLGGCEEEDVASFFGGADVTATKTETLELGFEEPLFLDLETANGAVMVRGAADVQTLSMIVTLRNRGKTPEEAEDRVNRIVYRIEQDGPRIGVIYRASEQASDVRRHGSVAFDILAPIEARVEIDTSNGSIHVHSINGALRLGTSNGAVDVSDSSGTLVAETSNGRIEVVRFAGDLDLVTSNGELRLDQIAGRFDARTSNGNVYYAGTPSATSRLRTSNGTITVRVPLTASIAFDAATTNAQIRSSLPLVGDMQGNEWRAQLNPPATATLELQTSNGPIRIEGETSAPSPGAP